MIAAVGLDAADHLAIGALDHQQVDIQQNLYPAVGLIMRDTFGAAGVGGGFAFADRRGDLRWVHPVGNQLTFDLVRPPL